MKMSVSRYSLSLVFQMFIICCDLLFNCWSLFPRSRGTLLLIFFFQDLCLVLGVASILITLFSTYLFQAGLVEVLVRKYRAAGALAAGYLLLSLALHSLWILDKWDQPQALSTPLILILFTLHRCMSAVYYCASKRAALLAADPRFYEDVDWLQRAR